MFTHITTIRKKHNATVESNVPMDFMTEVKSSGARSRKGSTAGQADMQTAIRLVAGPHRRIKISTSGVL